jgi:hypothetical protein
VGLAAEATEVWPSAPAKPLTLFLLIVILILIFRLETTSRRPSLPGRLSMFHRDLCGFPSRTTLSPQGDSSTLSPMKTLGLKGAMGARWKLTGAPQLLKPRAKHEARLGH